MVNGRTKGANYERKIAKLLSSWSGIPLRRTPMSGGWSEGHPEVSGDIVSVEPDKPFAYHVECKNNESWAWEATLKGKGPVYEWWKQATSQCPLHKSPWLIFSKAYRDDWLMMRTSDYRMGINTQIAGLIIMSFHGVVIVSLSDYIANRKYEQEHKLDFHKSSSPKSLLP